jgi:hypothetical protein
MLVRAWKEDDARGIDDDWSSVGVSDRQSSFFEDMKIAGLFVEVRGDAAEGSGVEHPGGEGELLEEWGETVHGGPDETIRYINDIIYNNTYHLISRWFLMGAEAPQENGERRWHVLPLLFHPT